MLRIYPFLIRLQIQRRMIKRAQSASPSKQKKNIETQKQQSNWNRMINGIVRPPRANYNQMQLGKSIFQLKQKMYIREDVRIQHQQKHLELTIYHSYSKSIYSIPYIILYMHGNSSCRLEALGLIKNIPEGVSLASFDFMGCGKNEQAETISLGYRQAEQARTVANYLRTKQSENRRPFQVILWGRSMGAATALLYGDAEFIVADSSFKSFKSLCKQVAKQHSPPVVPNCMISCFFPCVFTKIKKDVDKKAKYDVEDLDVRQSVKKLNPDTVVVFMSGDKDTLINKRNSQKLFNACPCEQKYLKIFSGDHNSKRPETTINQIMQLIQKHVIKKQPQTDQIV